MTLSYIKSLRGELTTHKLLTFSLARPMIPVSSAPINVKHTI